VHPSRADVWPRREGVRPRPARYPPSRATLSPAGWSRTETFLPRITLKELSKVSSSTAGPVPSQLPVQGPSSAAYFSTRCSSLASAPLAVATKPMVKSFSSQSHSTAAVPSGTSTTRRALLRAATLTSM